MSPEMTSLPAHVIAIEKRGDQYQAVVQISTKYRGSFNTLAFGEIKPYSGWLQGFGGGFDPLPRWMNFLLCSAVSKYLGHSPEGLVEFHILIDALDCPALGHPARAKNVQPNFISLRSGSYP